MVLRMGDMVYNRLEYIFGMMGYILATHINAEVFRVQNVLISGLVSVVFGIILVILTHFIKRYLRYHFPDKRKGGER